MIFIQSVFASQMQIIDSISQIPKNKNVILIFSMDFCPYCKRQERSILNNVKPKFKDMAYLKVMKGTKVFEDLIQTGNFGEVKYYPTTYILKIDKDNQMNVKYPFMGYQRSSYILDILQDKEIMED